MGSDDVETNLPANQEQDSAVELPFEFNGKAGEFFGIWIVNLVLSILTLGVYSPWAKVRTHRYFYGSTRLDGDAFSYHAKPTQILIARILVLIVFVLVSLVSSVEPRSYFVIYPALFFLFPWLITRSLRFQARVSRWRNVSFDWKTDYWATFVVLYLTPFVTVLTLGFGIPLVTRWTQKWAYQRLSFGDRPFTLEASLGRLYKLFFVLFAIGFVLYIIGLALIILPMTMIAESSTDFESPAAMAGIFGAILPGYIVLLSVSVVILVYRAGVRNIVFDGLKLDGVHRFRSSISKRQYALIVVTNLLAVIASLGFLTPWARIRMTRYVAENTFVIPGGPLDQFVDSVKESSGVIGEEYVDMEGIDIGVGL